MPRLKNQIAKRVSGYNKGYFVTVDTPLTTSTHNITRETLYRFGGHQLKIIAEALNA